jgi:uncharacterized protein (DUF885 family)
MKQVILAISVWLALFSLVSGQPFENPDSTKIEKVFDDYFREFIRLNPEEASQLGLPRESGYDYNRDGLDDLSDGGIKANYNLARKYLNSLAKIDKAKITSSQRIDAAMLEWLLGVQLEGEKYVDHRYYIDHLFGVHSQITNLLTEYHTIDDLQDANDYLKRLEKYPLRLKQTLRRIDSQEKKGIYPPVFIIERVKFQMNDFLQAQPDSNLLYLDFKGKLVSIDPATAEGLCKKARQILEGKIYPAYAEFIQRLKLSSAKADSSAGVWKLPDGEKYYAYCLKMQTTSSLSPEQVYQLGQEEVKSLQEQTRLLLDSLGIRGDRTYGELIREYWALWNNSENCDRFYYPDTPDRNQIILGDYQSLIDSTWKKLPELFSYLPRTKVLVQPVPEFKEAGGLTYYEPASLDGKRKAVFYVNMLQPLPKPNMRTLTYHETIPGHHYQIALQQELTQNRMFKNLWFLSGFGEGWAMYVEDLARESGWLPDIYSRIAELNSQLFRAVRIVVDAGIHYKRWTKEQAASYMQDNLGWSSSAEIDRYIVWPGQACSYTLGKLKIMQLREKAKKELGSKFDIKDFHMRVLENGSLPLEILEKVVDDYIKSP